MANSMAIDIPQDIIYQVIAAVDDDEELLKQCALVSSSFLIPSRKQLFSEIDLKNDKAAQRLHQCLIQNPVIQSFVKRIAIQPGLSDESNRLFNSPSLSAILQCPLCSLESFSIDLGDPCNWNNFSSELKDALSNIIHSSSLKDLSLTKVVNVPITLFLGIVHLTTLKLDSILPGDFDGGQSGFLTPETSKEVAIAASSPLVDQCVWHFHERVRGTRFPSSSAYFSQTLDMEGPTEPIFLPFMCRLRYFEIDFNTIDMDHFNILSFLIRSLRVSLTSPATLEHLKLNIWSWICGDNLHSALYAFYVKLRDADIWNHLDSIITLPIGSRLQRVDIDIDYAYHHDYDTEEPDKDHILEAVLDDLPLLREKGILFLETNIERG
jgi:hypothetical protein